MSQPVTRLMYADDTPDDPAVVVIGVAEYAVLSAQASQARAWQAEVARQDRIIETLTREIETHVGRAA